MSTAVENPAATARQEIARVLAGQQAGFLAALDEDYLAAVVQQAVEQRVAALLLERLETQHSAQHGVLREPLRQLVQVSAAFSLARQAALAQLHTGLAAAGIRAVLLKGTALAYDLYRQPYLRLGLDTDMFIGMAQLPATLEVLRREGFALHPPLYKSHQFSAIKPVAGGATFAVDVHWRVNNAPQFARSLAFEEIDEAAQEAPGAGGWRVPGRAHSLMIACLHLAGNPAHDRGRLIWLYDIHLLLESLTPAQRDQFIALAGRPGLAPACRAAVAAAGQLFAGNQHYHAWVETAVSEQPLSRYAGSQLALVLSDLRELPDMHSRLALLRELLFPGAEHLLAKYHKQRAAWLPLLYLRYLFSGLTRRLSLR